MKSRLSGSVAGPSATTASQPGSPPVDRGNPSRPGTIGGLLHQCLREHGAILASDVGPEPEDRVAHRTARDVRRLDAVLLVFAPVFDAAQAVQLRDELGWLGALLSEVSDRDELAVRLKGRLTALPNDDGGAQAVGDHIQRVLAMEKAVALARLGEALQGERYQQLTALLGQWRAAPPLTSKAASPLGVVDKYLSRGIGEFDRRLADALLSGDSEDLRQAGRTARYVGHAGEVGAEHLGRKTRKSVKRVGRLERLLLEHAAGVRTAELLLRVGPVGDTAGQLGSFTLGRLYEQELRRNAVLRGVLEQERG